MLDNVRDTEKSLKMPKTIMIVEDDEFSTILVDDLLHANDYNTVKVSDGVKVMDSIKANRPDLILMDIQLPGMSGLDLTKLIRADDNLMAIPIIAVTSFAMAGDKERILASGCDDYLSKPISIPALLEKITALLPDE
jgi:two-component system, cell cycle response regulator DivK